MSGMSRASRNFIIAYILLVGLPLLGLVGILKAGRQVSAPISVTGEWKLDVQAIDPLSTRCGRLLASFQNASITISQSGKALVVSSNISATTTGQGVIEEGTVRGVIPLGDVAASDQGCGNSTAVTFVANLELHAQPRQITGSIALDNCPSCKPVTFRAVRQGSAAKRKAH
jgi:hypothetical protein